MRLARRWASPTIAVAVLAIVVWRLGTGPFLDGIEAVDGTALVAAAGAVFVATVFAAWRWTIVAHGLGVRLSLPAAVAAYYRAVFLNLTLPSGIAGDVHRGLSHGREVHDMGGAIKAVIWERAAGQVVQAVLTIAILLVLPSPVRSSMPLVAAGAIAVAVAAVAVSRVRTGGAVSRWTRLRNTVVKDLRDGMLHPRALPAVLLTSVVVFAGHTATFLIAAHSAGATAPLSRLLPLTVLSLVAMVLPSIGGWGPREGATAWVFAAAGLGADRGAATAVAYGVLVLAASLPGAVVLIVGWLPRRHLPRRFDKRREDPVVSPFDIDDLGSAARAVDDADVASRHAESRR